MGGRVKPLQQFYARCQQECVWWKNDKGTLKQKILLICSSQHCSDRRRIYQLIDAQLIKFVSRNAIF
jgi:hypothetical protein